tara:strand:+ start:2742 stop:2921 length:180 start_codon:yes stop_codon:yes gene_type:complete
MSNFCPCCDDFSIDSSRATKKLISKKHTVKTKSKKIVINVDNSDENADWIKHTRKGDSE